ncbi:MAG: transposase [Candidatus Sericytochromatia bacterium]|nr:transposase [Candidatus Tanganyikabacteria bacterium]
MRSRPPAGRRRLFVIDGSKALRAGIDAVFGADNPVQRCRNHKLENVAGHLPEDDATYARLVMRAAFKMDAKEGIKKLKELAGRYQDGHPSAAGSLLEGLEELFTINRLGLPPALRRSLGTTNIIESPQGTMKRTMRRVTNWRSGDMALRWAAASGLKAERTMRKIGGYRDLSILDAALKEEVAQKRKIA